jgi:hypothetical protein
MACVAATRQSAGSESNLPRSGELRLREETFVAATRQSAGLGADSPAFWRTAAT